MSAMPSARLADRWAAPSAGLLASADPAAAPAELGVLLTAREIGSTP